VIFMVGEIGNITEIQKGIDVSNIHVDGPLSNMSLAYMQDEAEYINDKWFPIVTVPGISGVYYRFDKDTFFRNRVNKWTPGSKMTQGQFNVDHSGTYSCAFRAYEHPLPAHLAAAADQMVNIERAITEIVTRTLLLDREIQIASDFFVTGKWTRENPGAATGTYTYWNDYANSDLLANVKDLKLQVKLDSGMTSNTLTTNEQVWEAIRLHPQLKEIYKYTQAAIIDEAMIAGALGLKNILVARAVYESAAEDATSSMAYVFAKNAWVGYVAPQVGLMTPTAGAIFSWTGLTGGFNVALERVPDRRLHADFFQGITCYDDRVIAPLMGDFLLGITT
jgi:hypothetical protein